jgi:glutamate-1-semialdehyde aminotransferase
MANGYAMSAVIGTEKVMQAAQTTFISSTNWTDRIGPTAALATLRKYQANRAEQHLIATGERVKQIWRDAATKAGLAIAVSGLPSLASFGFQQPEAQALNTRFVVEMLQRGFLGFRQFKPSLAHGDAELRAYQAAVEDIFGLLSRLPESELLDSPVAHSGFQRLTKE